MSQSPVTEPVAPVHEPLREVSPAENSLALYHWVMLAGSVFVVAIAFLLSVVGNDGVAFAGLRLPGTCFLHDVVGIDCPGCGMTRSFVSLAHGDWRRAWQFNPAGPLLFLLLAAQIPFRAVQLWRLRIGAEPLDSPWLWLPLWGILAVIAVQWLARLAGWLTLPM